MLFTAFLYQQLVHNVCPLHRLSSRVWNIGLFLLSSSLFSAIVFEHIAFDFLYVIIQSRQQLGPFFCCDLFWKIWSRVFDIYYRNKPTLQNFASAYSC